MKGGAVFRSGVLEQLAELVAQKGITHVVFNLSTSGREQARIQEALGADVRVSDRVGVVLNIFKQRASSSEAVLQVKLAGKRWRVCCCCICIAFPKRIL